MRNANTCSLGVILILTTASSAALVDSGVPASRPAGTAPASQPAAGEPVWIEDFQQAHRRARESKKPMLVRAGAPWCGWCRKLDVEFETPLVTSQLARFVPVYLDVDEQPEQARKLHIGPIPALRLLSPSGSIVAEHNGFMPAAQLATWLQQNHEKVDAAVSEDLLAEGPLEVKAVTQLVARLDVQDAALRETIIRRLTPHRQVAGRAVTAAFLEGRLATRLTALELLREWRAPVDELDPWNPPTLTATRLGALRTWSEALPAPPVTTSPASRPQAQLDRDESAELARLLTVDDVTERNAIVERLARRGEELLPTIYERLAAAQGPHVRAVLTLLRYRVVASSPLVLAWPGGLEQLASPDVAARQSAAQELAKRATRHDARLLTELFSDPDPLVREMCLTALREVGGTEATGAITRLIDDPEANVRAAVLKVLAEKPNGDVVSIICEYARRESDADLVGHAARALRAARTDAAAEGLMALLEHGSWRVRAEAVEGLGEILKNRCRSPDSPANGYDALIDRLDDEDSFVAGRAMIALKDSPVIASALDPILRALKRHPELATSVIETLGSDHALRKKALPRLREFCKHPDASVRAVAVKAVFDGAGTSAQPELTAALADEASQVRVAAADALFVVLESIRMNRPPTGANAAVTRSIIRIFRSRSVPLRPDPSVTTASTQPASETWLDGFARGTGRPAWLDQLAPALEKMMSTSSPEEQIAAALCMSALGKREAATATLRELVKQKPDRLESAAAVLPWLRPESRIALFREWCQLSRSADALPVLCRQLSAWSEPEMLPALWDVLQTEWLAAEGLQGVLEPMIEIYLAEHRWQPAAAPPARLERMRTDAEHHLAGPSEAERLAALVILASASKEEAAAAARRIYEGSQPGTAMRRDAFHMLLLTQPRSQAESDAAAAIEAGDPMGRRVALRYLAMGPLYMRQLRQSIHLNFDVSSEFQEMQRNEARTYAPPAGLDVKVLERLAGEPDRETAACAAYLLALHQRQDTIHLLVRFWREVGQRDDVYQQLLYRAIAAANDTSQVPVLEEIYSRFQKGDYRLRDFYWSIRSMTGERAVALRKKIRDETGMQGLQ